MCATGRWRYFLIMAVAFGVALTFYEKAVLLAGELPLLSLVLEARRIRVGEVLAVARRRAFAWLTLLIITAAYLVFYVGQHYGSITAMPSLHQVASAYGIFWLDSFVPGLLGGPITWRDDHSFGACYRHRISAVCVGGDRAGRDHRRGCAQRRPPAASMAIVGVFRCHRGAQLWRGCYQPGGKFRDRPRTRQPIRRGHHIGVLARLRYGLSPIPARRPGQRLGSARRGSEVDAMGVDPECMVGLGRGGRGTAPPE